MKNNINKEVVRQLTTANAQPTSTRKPHFDITTAQLLDPDYDDTAFLEFVGGVAESERVARIMLSVMAASSQVTTDSKDGQLTTRPILKGA